MLMLLPPLKRLTGITATIQRGLAAAESVFEILDEAIEPGERTTNGKIELNGCINFDNISFSYPGQNKDVIKDLTLEIKCGSTVALVGESGSGKTTISSLLSRFYDTDDGDITIDNISIYSIPLNSLRENISIVPQDIRLINGTISENVAYAEKTIDEEKIKRSLISAHAWNFVNNLPNGIDTFIGQNGSKLSGGQRQRIAISRAFYKDAPILILDEATSALDTESERKIQDAIDNLMKTRTTLVIAHRLSTIEHSDKIIVMQSGRIVESGTHSELYIANGEYRHYYDLQFKDQ